MGTVTTLNQLWLLVLVGRGNVNAYGGLILLGSVSAFASIPGPRYTNIWGRSPRPPAGTGPMAPPAAVVTLFRISSISAASHTVGTGSDRQLQVHVSHLW